MKRAHRLRQRSRFQEVRRQGKCWPGRLMVLCALPNDLSWSRFGFSVSRRIGKAVVRNRARRRMSEAVRLRQNRIAAGWDLVFIARSPIVQAEYKQIERDCEKLLRQAGLFDVVAKRTALDG